MASKIFLLATLVASAWAGGPAAYTISAPSIDGAYVGSSHEHTVKGLYGQNSVSQYSNSADSAHSSVRVSSSRTSNDVLGYAPGYGGHGLAPALAAPAIKIAAAPAYASAAYAAPAYAAHGLAAHGLAAHGLAAHGLAAHGITAHGLAAPAIAGYAAGYAAPALAGYASHSLGGYAAPALAGYAAGHHYGTHLTAAPALRVAAAPALSIAHGGGHLLGVGALGHGYGGYAAPLAVKTAVAAPLVHTSFAGHGAHYAY